MMVQFVLQNCNLYAVWVLSGIIVVYDLAVFLFVGWRMAVAALVKAFNMLLLGVVQPYLARQAANNRYKELINEV